MFGTFSKNRNKNFPEFRPQKLLNLKNMQLDNSPKMECCIFCGHFFREKKVTTKK